MKIFFLFHFQNNECIKTAAHWLIFVNQKKKTSVVGQFKMNADSAKSEPCQLVCGTPTDSVRARMCHNQLRSIPRVLGLSVLISMAEICRIAEMKKLARMQRADGPTYLNPI